MEHQIANLYTSLRNCTEWQLVYCLVSPIGWEWDFRMRFGGHEVGSAYFANHLSCIWVIGPKANYQSMVTDTSRQMAAGVGFLMHDELSHLLVWPYNAHGQGMFSKKNRRNHHLKTRKSQAVISFHLFIVRESSAVAESGRNPAGTWGQSRWQSLSWYPGEVTFCQNKGLRLLETTPKMGINPSGKAVERAQRIIHRPCHTLSSTLQ